EERSQPETPGETTRVPTDFSVLASAGRETRAVAECAAIGSRVSPFARAARFVRICPRWRVGSILPAEAKAQGRFGLFQKPLDGGAGDFGRDAVGTVEFLEFDGVAGPLQARDDAAAAGVDGEELVLRAVGNEDARGAGCFHAVGDEAGGEGHDAAEE